MKSWFLGGPFLSLRAVGRRVVLGEKWVYFLGNYELEDRSFADRKYGLTEKRRNPSSLRKVDSGLDFGLWWQTQTKIWRQKQEEGRQDKRREESRKNIECAEEKRRNKQREERLLKEKREEKR
jgi:hypothetical protein